MNEIVKKADLTNSLADNCPPAIRKMAQLMDSKEAFRAHEVDFANKQWDETKTTLQRVSFDMGQRVKLEDYELQRLCEHLKKHFAGLNVNEVEEAFSLYQAKKLDFTDGYYQSFDKLFLGNVLSSYKRHKQKVLANLSNYRKKREDDKIDSLEYFEKKLFKPYKELLEGKPYTLSEMDEWFLYKAVDGLGIEMCSTDEKQQFMIEAEQQIEWPRRISEDDKHKKTRSKAISLAFRNWLQNQAFEGVDVEKLIKESVKN